MALPRIPGIELEGELGHGAYSVVYQARQGGARCALKIPRKKGRWTPWVYREAVALARVHHPALPTVLEVGEADGLPFLLMELVEGETLAVRLARGSLSEVDTIAIARHLAGALAAVHDAGLVHRDVKPRNIILEPSGRLRLVDFGFATPTERVGVVESAGTPSYAAPEQLRTPSRVDERTDLYGVGRVLCECLTGRLPEPPGAPGHAGTVRAELMAAGVGDPLARVVDALVSHDPDRRYPHARAFSSDLARIESGRVPLGPQGYERERPLRPLVARIDARERLLRALDRVSEEAGHVVRIVGTRGSGKTHLLQACVAARPALRQTVLYGSCRDSESPLATLRRILDAYVDATLRATQQRQHLLDAVRSACSPLAPFALLITPRMSELLVEGAEGKVPSAESFPEGAAELMVRMGRALGPLIVCVDDAQWLDPISHEVLDRVAHRIGDAPIGLILAARPSSRPAQPAPTDRRTTVIDLGPLDEADTGKLVASHLGEATVEPALVKRVATLADGTPLGVLEVLGGLLDLGAVRPHAGAWRFDVSRADRIELPEGSLALLGRRIRDLPAATRRVLEGAAVVGSTFDDALLGRIVGLEVDDLDYALAQARRAGIVETAARHHHRFVHDSIPEALLGGMSDRERRRLHQRTAEVLDVQDDADLDSLVRIAAHYQAGEPERAPVDVFRVSRAAAAGALARFDNDTALRFLELARSAAAIAKITLDASFHQGVGEAQFRVGAHDESLASFQAALACASEPASRATILGRIAWIHQTYGMAAPAWDALGLAFAAVNERMPIESIGSAAQAARQLARFGLGAITGRVSSAVGRSRLEVELLCDLHYANVRFALENDKPLRVIESALEAMQLSQTLGRSSARARALAVYGCVVATVSQGRAGTRELMQAQEVAAEVRDPVAVAFCLQMRATAECWIGDLDVALQLFNECVDGYGPWLELNEYSYDVTSAELVEALRGRSSRVLASISRAIERLRRSPRAPASSFGYLLYRARAALAGVGRDVESDPWLSHALRRAAEDGDARAGFRRLLGWGPRARYFAESGEVGSELDALVSAFEAERQDPRKVHLAFIEYYVAVAHARMHQCLRASQSERVHRLAALRVASRDLTAAARRPIVVAHARLVEGVVAFLEGRHPAAQAAWSKAEAVAARETCPWVTYGVARARAHFFREQKKEGAAREQARLAEMVALEHGSVPRARWIREEFGLTREDTAPTQTASSLGRSSRRARRQLAALLDVLRLPRVDVTAAQQAAAVVDELLRHLDAERGMLLFQPDAAQAPLVVSRQRHGQDWNDPDGWRLGALRAVHASAGVVHLDDDSWTSLALQADVSRVMLVPLFLRERAAGAVCIERTTALPPFGVEEHGLLDVLCQQVPVALELARLVAEHEQLQASLQHAQKMESLGQLAGGLAHDFNNMLLAIRGSAASLREEATLEGELGRDLDIIFEATDRAAALTKQLLAFSQHHDITLEPTCANELIASLAPMVRKLLGSGVALETRLEASHQVSTDPAAFEQALVNLALNARDAMPGGGTLTIETKDVVLDAAARRRGLPALGAAVLITISDVGEGMPREVLSRIFEPFFTTKALGTGLGLATVYAFVKKCNGYIDASSEVGRGTTFRLYLPRATALPAPSGLEVARLAAMRTSTAARDGPILVVDDDETVRRSIARMLRRHGHDVLAVRTSAEALRVAEERGPEIPLVILDVVMPEMGGPDLARALAARGVGARVIYVSGYAPASTRNGNLDLRDQVLLQKPFTADDLLGHVNELLPAKKVSETDSPA
jgi:signal transduction histidine kinase/CheY-like chemotaxis protein/type II secretory pathway predicted ATPase ExeA